MKHKAVEPVMADYLAAVNNEIAIDQRFFRMSGLSPHKVGYLPRVPKWLDFGRRYPATSRLLSITLRHIWLAGGAFIFFVLQFIPLFLRSRSEGAALSRIIGQTFILGLSSRTMQMSMPFSELDGLTWIHFPWVEGDRRSTAAKIEYSDLLSRSDIWRALVNAVKAVYLLASSKRRASWLLQSYTAFRWFSVRSAVDKLNGPIVITEHFDRWAVLVDSSVARRRHGIAEIILVQHGSVEPVSTGEDIVPVLISLPRRLRAVRHLWAYDRRAEFVFKRDILSRRCFERILSVSFFVPRIELCDLDEYDGFHILFVGHPLCEKTQCALFYKLREKFPFLAYYKPHPRAPMSDEMGRADWTIVKGKTTFPKVDMLVSYPSTLVTEYQGAGVPSAVHPIDMTLEQMDEFYERVVELIQFSG